MFNPSSFNLTKLNKYNPKKIADDPLAQVVGENQRLRQLDEEGGETEELLGKCNEYGKKGTSFKDCNQYTRNDNETICCYVRGNSNGKEESTCLEVDSLFKGKTITYTGTGVSGKLICSEDSFGYHLNLGIISFALTIAFPLLF